MSHLFDWLTRDRQPRGLILLYHRIDSTDVDPWGLCVRPEHFAEQLEVLRTEAVPLPLHEFVRAQSAGTLPRRAVAVTFDDGYADNLTNAKPLLERFQVPATVFVASDYIGGEREFWWDLLEQVLLRPGSLPATLYLQLREQDYCWDLGEAREYSEEAHRKERARKAWEGQPGSRHHLYYTLWQALQPLPESERRSVLATLARWAGITVTLRDSHRPLTAHELLTLARCDLVTIGAHTVTHPLLTKHPLPLQREEIRASKEHLEKLLGHPVIGFAYPYGGYTRATLSVVREAGFTYACTTRAEGVRRGTDPFELPRFEVEDWNGEEFRKRLQEWFCC
ncbi:MAG: polysaccharide deacetylase family protein [Candidatus Binatia bacterium]|nr:polysaccharide deacetylase family protein [Candidatus Binatia bacterium]